MKGVCQVACGLGCSLVILVLPIVDILEPYKLFPLKHPSPQNVVAPDHIQALPLWLLKLVHMTFKVDVIVVEPKSHERCVAR